MRASLTAGRPRGNPAKSCRLDKALAVTKSAGLFSFARLA